ncbi:hypothetical protein OG339_20055 [Streptosporangium sp. NBC_01495]|uniref:hypothetical protein n=1 Tax=Streptosporangium sp. NBC_01495 TaxID=2903899 RepID=UPI002E344417|nr:hypothetical protein [Streptosporangium sp. NBC_01495]
MITADDQLISVVAERTGLTREALFGHVVGARIQGAFSYPLSDEEADDTVRGIITAMTRVIPIGLPAEVDPASRYVWLHEMTAHYVSAETRMWQSPRTVETSVVVIFAFRILLVRCASSLGQALACPYSCRQGP